MHVDVHESGKDESAAPIDRLGAWMSVANHRVVAAGSHATLVYQKPAVLMTRQRSAIADVEMQRILWRVKNARAKKLHYLSARRRTWRTAKKTRSGVAGLSNVKGPPSPNAAMAARNPSRTENASISGGSPTALLPMTTPGWVACSSISTLKISGTSDHEGSL